MMGDEELAAMGLRERSKARRRAAIVDAALELFAERGYDATTIADIAEAAEVAPRTVSLYFPAKQDMALARVTEWADRLGEALGKRTGETALDVIGGWLRGELARVDPRELDLVSRMFAANPELRGLTSARLEAVAAESARALAAELGVGPEDPRARIATAAMSAVIEAAWEVSRDTDIDETVDLAVGFLRSGMERLRRG